MEDYTSRINIRIASIALQINAAEQGIKLLKPPTIRGFENNSFSFPDFTMTVYTGLFSNTDALNPVFTAENLEGEAHAGPVVWKIFKRDKTFLLEAKSEGTVYQLLYRLNTRHWKLYANSRSKRIHPFPHPIDGLIIYLMLTVKGGILIHASGLQSGEQGYLFSGVSGRGKSTIARLFSEAGASMVNDDRLAVRKIKGKWWMFNTPMFYPDKERHAGLHHIFLIYHAPRNWFQPLTGTDALAQTMAFCIQHHYSKTLINSLLNQLISLISDIPVAHLGFTPDNQVISDVKSFAYGYR